MKKIFGSGFVILLLATAFGCQKTAETSIETKQNSNIAVQPTQTQTDSPNKETFPLVELSKLANKSAAEVDKILGKPVEIKKIENGGQYRLYKIANHPKGLAVRFYQKKAGRFNLILSEPFPSAKEALLKSFGMDVGNTAPTGDKNEPLTEIWKGTFGGVKFSKVSAKRAEGGGGFIFVLADVE